MTLVSHLQGKPMQVCGYSETQYGESEKCYLVSAQQWLCLQVEHFNTQGTKCQQNSGYSKEILKDCACSLKTSV
jgi:hypothetical protein